MPAEFQKKYQSKTGSLNYASIVSRPDISTAVSILCRFNSNPNETHMAAVDRAFEYLLGNIDLGPRYKHHEAGESLPLNDLHIMVDSD